jgi:hypothetical protein
MWRIWLGLGACVWLATIASSAAINFLAGHHLGRTPAEALVFGILGVGADVWKALGPIFIVTLWRARQRSAAALASLVWLVCFLFAVSASLGLTAENRQARAGAREALHLDYLAAQRELADVDARRAAISERRTTQEIEQAIAAVMARPLAGHGTVASLSLACHKDMWRTRAACLEVAGLRVALAAASEREKLEAEASRLARRISTLQTAGAREETDAQASLISRLSFGRIAVGDVNLVVVLLLAAMVELISAFAPVVLHEYARARRRQHAVVDGRDVSRHDTQGPGRPDHVYEFIAARVVPDVSGRVARRAVIDDYEAWCRSRGSLMLTRDSFASALEQIFVKDLAGKVRADGEHYVGFRLRSGCNAPLLAKPQAQRVA